MILSLFSLFLTFSEARPNYEKKEILIGAQKITVEIADTEEKRTHGLMFVKKLEKDQGMLFIFESERPLAFWMKNTLIPLSIAYFNSKKEIVDIQDMFPESSLLIKEPKTYPSRAPAQYALEMNLGWFKSHGIKNGTKWKYVGSK
ncbi:MAG: DUF192 domain-containing protein [Bdellovibrionales bacterium]